MIPQININYAIIILSLIFLFSLNRMPNPFLRRFHKVLYFLISFVLRDYEVYTQEKDSFEITLTELLIAVYKHQVNCVKGGGARKLNFYF